MHHRTAWHPEENKESLKILYIILNILAQVQRAKKLISELREYNHIMRTRLQELDLATFSLRGMISVMIQVFKTCIKQEMIVVTFSDE